MDSGSRMVTATPSRHRSVTPFRFLRITQVSESAVADGWPPLWWVGCHGGAGATTLARVTGVGGDMGAAWPLVQPHWATQPVVLVARATAVGLHAAMATVEQWQRRAVPGVRVLGLVVVAASPKRPPKVVTDRVQLLQGWVPRLWRVGWVEPLLAADDPLDVGVPPDVETVRHALGQILNSEVGEK